MTYEKTMIRSRRELILAMGTTAVGAAVIGGRRLAVAAPIVPQFDENLPDTSTYQTFQHPVSGGVDYISDLYGRADRMTAETRRTLPHYLNVPYGSHVKQRLDIYLPKDEVRDAPVFLFVHGGGFEEGHRAHYGYVAAPYAARGVITAVTGYRLATDGFQYPAQVNDIKQALSWLHRSIASYGGNPNSLFMSGHSAGAMLVAEVGVDRSWMPESDLPTSALKGFAAVSGMYDFTGGALERFSEKSNILRYVPTRAQRAKASALRHIRDPAPAAVVAYGEGEAYERELTQSSPAFWRALRAKAVDAQLVAMPDGTHISMVFALATRGSPLYESVVSMIERYV